MSSPKKRTHITVREKAAAILNDLRVGRLDYNSVIEYLLVRADFMQESECAKDVFQTSQLIENFFNKAKRN